MAKKRTCYCKSSWQKRNNSKNVAVVLNPGSSSFKCSCKRHFLSGNTCYCCQQQIPPQLFSKPKQCVHTDIGDIDEEKSSTTIQHSGKTGRLKFCKTFDGSCKKPSQTDTLKTTYRNNKHKVPRFHPQSLRDDISDSSYQTDTIKEIITQPKSKSFRSNSKTNKEDSVFGFSDDKQNDFKSMGEYTYTQAISPTSSHSDVLKNGRNTNKYHKSHNTFEDVDETFDDPVGYLSRYKNDLEELEQDSATYERKSQNGHHFIDDDKDKTSINKVQKEASLIISKTNSAGHISESKHQVSEQSLKSDLKRLSDFRMDHYFETHSTEDLLKPIPEHICVHSFDLDDRLLPRALYADVYGASRCIICNKLMNCPPVNKIDERTVHTNGNIFPKFYKYGLAPKKIYIGNDDNIRINMKLDREDEYCKIKMPKDVNYFNTFALKYQKMAH